MYLNLGGGGKTRKPVWRNAGCVVGEGYSVAWRMLDAQYWGVPSVVRESTLSQILEDNAPEKYFLSARACEGILRRAEKRGKKLPLMLWEALVETIEFLT